MKYSDTFWLLVIQVQWTSQTAIVIESDELRWVKKKLFKNICIMIFYFQILNLNN